MIQDVNSDMTLLNNFRAKRSSVYQLYGLTSRECALLEDGSIEAMAELGVHPNLQVKFLRASSQGSSEGNGKGGLPAFLARLTGES
ncbi:hypothetical protein UB46_34465 [Burkholderiaceae bacterium 16]|nr:hypothetical protein UB46_34465 [Burkholderiaceae bacterium 16]